MLKLCVSCFVNDRRQKDYATDKESNDRDDDDDENRLGQSETRNQQRQTASGQGINDSSDIDGGANRCGCRHCRHRRRTRRARKVLVNK
jgi:hypothetical protein